MINLFRRRASPLAAPNAPPLCPPPDFMKDLVHSLTEGVVAVDGRKHILLANPAVGEILNQPYSQAIGKPLWEVLRHREMSDLLDRVFQSGQTETKEIAFGSSNDRIFEVRMAPIKTGEKISQVVATFHDVTALRRLEQGRREFVANVSHELKTPLTALSAALETLLDGALDDPQHARDFLITAQEQTTRLQRLIEDLLALSRLDRPQTFQPPASCPVQETCRRVVKALTPLAQKSAVTLKLDLASDLLSVAMTEDELTQVLVNLLDNAIKFNRPDGRVDVRARLDEFGVVIEIKDTGVGISPEDQARVFERFYRADKSRGSERGGTGLGLAIVKHIVENRGGTVAVTSGIGQGSVFLVRIPRP
ncbi:MAG: PAS domain-containing protein [Elusimicrobia bacterium]|nr:PAS domain-containing protein [Elusimicrobiota bacterium]